MADLDCYDALCELQADHAGPHKDAQGATWPSFTEDAEVPSATRRLARFTVDVLLPENWAGVDLSKCEVASITVAGDEDDLTDVIQTTAVPARLVLTDG